MWVPSIGTWNQLWTLRKDRTPSGLVPVFPLNSRLSDCETSATRSYPTRSLPMRQLRISSEFKKFAIIISVWSVHYLRDHYKGCYRARFILINCSSAIILPDCRFDSPLNTSAIFVEVNSTSQWGFCCLAHLFYTSDADFNRVQKFYNNNRPIASIQFFCGYLRHENLYGF